MSVSRAIRFAALTLVAGAALAVPMGARADVLGGLSIRAGLFLPQEANTRDVVGTVAWGGGIDYKIPWFPRLLNGEAWATSLSVDFHYSERKAGLFRAIPVSINQVYTFEEQHGVSPYAGFCITGNTFGGRINNVPMGEGVGTVRVPMVTRFGLGLVLGANFAKNFYVDGRYEWYDHHGLEGFNPDGFRLYLGYRFK